MYAYTRLSLHETVRSSEHNRMHADAQNTNKHTIRERAGGPQRIYITLHYNTAQDHFTRYSCMHHAGTTAEMELRAIHVSAHSILDFPLLRKRRCVDGKVWRLYTASLSICYSAYEFVELIHYNALVIIVTNLDMRFEQGRQLQNQWTRRYMTVGSISFLHLCSSFTAMGGLA